MSSKDHSEISEAVIKVIEDSGTSYKELTKKFPPAIKAKKAGKLKDLEGKLNKIKNLVQV